MTDPSWTPAATLALQIAMGVSLAACAGLRAFLPLLVVGVAGRMGWVPLAESFAWLASTPALVTLASAVVAELLGDKVPLIDHLLDTLQVVIKPVAGTLLVAGVLTDLTPLQSIVLGAIAGAVPAEAVHLVKAKVRLISTAATAGLGNPFLSVAEDAGALGGSVVALLLPLVAFGALIVFAVLLVLALRRTRRRMAWPIAQRPPAR